MSIRLHYIIHERQPESPYQWPTFSLTSTTSAISTNQPLKLWYYFWSPAFDPEPGQITVSPDSNVHVCKEKILEVENIAAPSRILALYSVLTNLSVRLDNLKDTLGALSLSSLGEPLAVHLQVGSVVGAEPRPDHLHLIVVNREIPLTVVCWIYGTTTTNVHRLQVARGEPIQFLLREIKANISDTGGQPDGSNLILCKSSFSSSEGVGDVEGQPLPNMQMMLYEAFSNIPFSRLPCVIIRTTPRERKHYRSWDIVERATKHQKTVPPSGMGISPYHSMQVRSETRFFDYRTQMLDPGELPEKDLPPIEILFDGFGEFLDVWRVTRTPGCAQVDVTQDMQENVDNFASSMSRTFPNEEARRQVGLEALDAIFKPVLGARQVIAPSDVSSATAGGHPPRSDGHYSYGTAHIPCFIVEFKNEDAGTVPIPAVELATYYQRMVGYVGQKKPDALRRSRLPTLGMTVIGPTVTFFGLAYVGAVIYVPLTTSFWCLPIECGGSDRRQLYVAFSAASALLARIEEDATVLSAVSPPPIIKDVFFPQIRELSSYHDPKSILKLRITDILSKTLNRHLYKAISQCGSLIIKLTRSYSPELHQFCADLGHAPGLYAAQRLPGGFVAVAMEYLDGDALGSLRWRISPAYRDKWTNDLEELVKRFHEAQFVHGDLRPPNFLCVGDKLMLLDFDWGGREGEASYPHRRLNAQLTEGRDMTSLKITKEDDKRVLSGTLEYIRKSAQ